MAVKKKPVKKVSERIEVPPGYEMSPGEIYELQSNLHCRDGNILPAASLLIVLHKSQETPYGEVGPYGYNLICKSANGITTWSTAESCFHRGLLRFIGTTS